MTTLSFKKTLSLLMMAVMIIGLLMAMSFKTAAANEPTVGSIVRFGDADWMCIDTGITTGYKLLRVDTCGSPAFATGGIPYTDTNNSLRSYLNNDFYNGFSAAQKTQIRLASWNCGYINHEGDWTVDDYIGTITYSEFYAIKSQPWYIGRTHWWTMTAGGAYPSTAYMCYLNTGELQTWGALSAGFFGTRPALYLSSIVTFTLVGTKYYPIGEPFPTFTVTYDAEGGSVSPSTQTKRYNSTYGVDANGSSAVMPTPTRTGYDFNGWYDGDDGTGNLITDSTTVTTAADHTLHAKWTAHKYSVAYNGNKPSGASSNVTGTTIGSSHTYDAAKTLSDNGYALTGYTFLGWSTNANAASPTYTDEQSVSNLSAIDGATVTLYAVWRANDYTVNYNGNKPSGASGSVTGTTASSNHQYDTAKALTGNGFSLAGYTFTGWSTQSDATAATYTDGQSVSNLTASDGGAVTLYAVWTANKYSVLYDGNKPHGASGIVTGMTIGSSHIFDTAKTLTENGYALIGYTFLGWSTDSGAASAAYTDGQSVSNLTSADGKTVTLYAVWKVNQYSVGYNSNKPAGASGSVTGTTIGSSHTYDIPKALSENGYALPGYTFTGWSMQSNAVTAAYTDGQSVSNLTAVNGATVTLYAVWRVNQYSVSYNGNKPSGASGAVTGITLGSSHSCGIAKSLTENGYALTGYTFKGWSKLPDPATVTYTDGQSVTDLSLTDGATVTLYAVWEANDYTVEYNGSKPSGAKDDVTGTTASSSHVYDTAKALTQNGFALIGYKFLGWSRQPNAVAAAYTDQQSVLNLTAADGGTVTLYAVWEPKLYTVYLNSDGTNVDVFQQYYNRSVSRPADPVKYGYTFIGWYSDRALTVPVSWPLTMPPTDMTLFAKWWLNSYTALFNTNGGNDVASVTQFYSSFYNKPSDPTKAGYIFAGWYTDIALTKAVTWPRMLIANETLYAKWTIAKFTVTLNSNGGSGDTAFTQDYNTDVTLSSAPVKTGFTFTGWNTKPDGSGTNYGKDSTFKLTGDITLYAVWKTGQSGTSAANESTGSDISAPQMGGTGVNFGLIASISALFAAAVLLLKKRRDPDM